MVADPQRLKMVPVVLVGKEEQSHITDREDESVS
jgi:hypothetical protein